VNFFADGVLSDTDDPLLSQKEPIIPKVNRGLHAVLIF